MSNTVLSWRNWLLHHTHSSITSAAPTVNNIENLLTPRLSEVATFVNFSEPEGESQFSIGFQIRDDTDTAIDVAIGVVGLLSVIGVQNVSHVENLYVLIRNAANENVFESGSTPYLLSSTDGFNQHVWLLLPTEVIGSNVYVEIQTQGGGLVDHTISVGGAWIGPLFTTDLGLEEGWGCEIKDLGEMGKSIGQQGYPQVKRRYRVITGEYAAFDRTTAYGDPLTPDVMDAQRLMFEIGTTGFCVFFPITKNELGTAQDEHIVHRLGTYGHFDQFGKIDKQGADDYKWGPFVFKECM